MEYISSVHPLDITYLDGYPPLLPPKEAGTCALVFPFRLSPPTDDFLWKVTISSASVWSQPPAKNLRKAPILAACPESRQYFSSLHCLSTMSLQKTHLSYSLFLASSREKLPSSIGAALHFPPPPAPALLYSSYWWLPSQVTLGKKNKKKNLYLLSETSLKHQDSDSPSRH